MLPPEERAARRLARYTAMLYRAIREPDLTPEERAAIVADVSRLTLALDGEGGSPVAKVFRVIEDACLARRVMGTSLDAVTSEAIEGLHDEIGSADALAVDRKWLAMAIERWERPEAGARGVGKYEALSRALSKTSLTRKAGSLKTAHLDWKKGGRSKRSGRRKGTRATK